MFGSKRRVKILPMTAGGLPSSWPLRPAAQRTLGGKIVRAAKKALLALPVALVVALVALLALAITRRRE